MNIGKTTATVTWQKIEPGSHVFEAGNAVNFHTGDWRSDKPVFIKEKCKQCLLCFPVCPDSAIKLSKEGAVEGFDLDFCKGCLCCMKVCPFKAIEKEEA
jgi:pyruvate ferredoxin oxidoreductase delta subunit